MDELKTLDGKTIRTEIEEQLDDISVALMEAKEKLLLIRELGVQDEDMAEALNQVIEAESTVDTYIANNV